jgi:predicted amidohydrolase YtcJ
MKKCDDSGGRSGGAVVDRWRNGLRQAGNRERREMPRSYLLLVLFFAATAYGRDAPPDLILVNGRIFTAETDSLPAQALAIRGERIVAVGTTAEIETLAGAKTRRIDAQQRVVTPGFNDAHFHFAPDPTGFAIRFETNEPSWPDTSAAIKAAVKQTPPGTWIFADVGYHVVLGRTGYAGRADGLAPTSVRCCRAYYGHGYIATRDALPLRTLPSTNPIAGGYYERIVDSNPDQRPVLGYAEWKPNRQLASQVADADALVALRQLADAAVRAGITSMQIFSQCRSNASPSCS